VRGAARKGRPYRDTELSIEKPFAIHWTRLPLGARLLRMQDPRQCSLKALHESFIAARPPRVSLTSNRCGLLLVLGL
jgi:hypothetical protein